MADNELKDFNGKDDWLAQEIRRESRVSAWDLDDARRLKTEHEENCDVEDNAKVHRSEHRSGESQYIKQGSSEKKTGSTTQKAQSEDIKWFVVLFITVFVLFFINSFLPGSTGIMILPPIIAFLAINPGIFIWLLAAKRFPAKWYTKSIFFIVVIMEIVLLVTNYGRYLLFLLGRYL